MSGRTPVLMKMRSLSSAGRQLTWCGPCELRLLAYKRKFGRASNPFLNGFVVVLYQLVFLATIVANRRARCWSATPQRARYG